ncbi:DUF4974 domain-containing protein [Muricauda sp. SCSIO 64092]|uniref:FecR family protein n=1 Tax=Allomuricauda sp. SCSIO 64092 TaxID=2908842 RepID=UPI001FF43A64|nr:FecR family protein [Muricauda sp. SCSIO 64092]UOY08344.1 DUF4974 domain-containing protein [Muricauda sp. SCSIO 64092]
MKETERFRKLITKFLGREANAEELDHLETYLKGDQNLSVFNGFVRAQFLISLYMGEYDLENAKKSIAEKVRVTNRKRKLTNIGKVTSILVFTSMVVFLGLFVGRQKTVETKIPVEIGKYKAILTLENGDQMVLEKDRTYNNGRLTSDGRSITYAKSNTNGLGDEKSHFHFLTIPRGGRFFVELSDGTKVWLNSDSKIKYPVRFERSKPRVVELLYGEAYFEVSPGAQNGGVAFDVLTRNQNIRVLGTKFNVKAYNNENTVATTLVEGSVAVANGGELKILKPNDQSLVHDGAEQIEILQVDAIREVSWVNNLFVFEEESLEAIMKELSRWYNVETVFQSMEKKELTFTAVLERNKKIEEVLELFEVTSEGENLDFEIVDGIIIVK